MWTLIGIIMASVGVPLVVVILYMCGGFAERSGWRRLATVYRANGRSPGTRHWFQSAALGGFGFHGILILGASAEGLYMKPIWLLRAFHPPLLVPWSELRAESHTAARTTGVRLWFDRVADLPLDWSEATHRRVLGLDPPALPTAADGEPSPL